MAKFKFTGDEERVFLFPRAFNVLPGDTVEADENPDPYWFTPVVGAKTVEKEIS